jgi:putative chitinase
MRPVLRRGSSGFEVERLQSRLATLGFSPGQIDGRFGPATEAALLGAQRALGLLADGVCGPATWRALELGVGPEREDVTGRIDVTLVAAMFPHTALRPIARHLPQVLDALRARGLVDKPMVLTALATIRAESEGFEPVSERISRFNTSPAGPPFDLYDHRHDLGNEGPPDGARFRGRGFVQLTGRDNYRRFGWELGLGDGLLDDPERANEPATAAALLALFLGAHERRIKEALLEDDLRRVRRLVNGGSHGLERFSDAYRRGERLLTDQVWTVAANDDRPVAHARRA